MNFNIEEQEYEESVRSMSLNSITEEHNDLKDSKNKASILPMLSHTDSLFMGIVTPSRATVRGGDSEAQNTSIMFSSTRSPKKLMS